MSQAEPVWTDEPFNVSLYCGDCVEVLKSLPDESVQCCITSPPYWRLRNYEHTGQFGMEETPEDYVANLVTVFREVWRVLRSDGTVWLNLGDSYFGSGKGLYGDGTSHGTEGAKQRSNAGSVNTGSISGPTSQALKPKDLVGIPWRTALALQADGWWLRQDIIWQKPNPMPESTQDRCTRSHEYIFLLTKSRKYYYDNDAIAEPLAYPDETRRPIGSKGAWQIDGRKQGENGGGNPYNGYPSKRNKRSVWTVTTGGNKAAHFAVFPPKLITPCILAGAPPNGVTLDPFAGSGTVAATSVRLGRGSVAIDLQPEYMKLCHKSIVKAINDKQNAPLFGTHNPAPLNDKETQ